MNETAFLHLRNVKMHLYVLEKLQQKKALKQKFRLGVQCIFSHLKKAKAAELRELYLG